MSASDLLHPKTSLAISEIKITRAGRRRRFSIPLRAFPDLEDVTLGLVSYMTESQLRQSSISLHRLN